MSLVQSSTRTGPKVRVPRSWVKDRIPPTHFIYNGVVQTGGKGAGKGSPEIPHFGSGWRAVALESEGHKWAHVIECGSGTRAKIGLELWRQMVSGGRVLDQV